MCARLQRTTRHNFLEVSAFVWRSYKTARNIYTSGDNVLGKFEQINLCATRCRSIFFTCFPRRDVVTLYCVLGGWGWGVNNAAELKNQRVKRLEHALTFCVNFESKSRKKTLTKSTRLASLKPVGCVWTTTRNLQYGLLASLDQIFTDRSSCA